MTACGGQEPVVLTRHGFTTQEVRTIMGIRLCPTVLVVAANLVVDLGHALLDPRVRLEYRFSKILRPGCNQLDLRIESKLTP